MKEETAISILEELKRINRLLIHRELNNLEGDDQKGKIIFLSGLGYGPTEIAGLLGTTANSVNVALARSRKSAKAKK